MRIILNPNLDQFKEIEHWLIEELQTTREGFYNNWDIIKNYFGKKQVIILEKDNKSIGFACWSNSWELYAGLEIMAIHPDFRRSGFGKWFYEKIEAFFKKKKFFAVELHCSPPTSESFWKKMNFIKFPERGYSDPPLMYYKPLMETNDPVEIESELSDKLELWDLEPYQVKEQKPRWTWKMGENDRPIIQPCNRDWKLRLTIGGEVITENKIKYFDRNVEIDVGSFLYIESKQYMS
ncbi:GNAT family N-acetyltransferase [Elizabethkingia anophelis]|uniref:N-acetyltransferase domain-containing protein n=1 Tax=Elizabethkingia anophelis TaxID=1117645 RepID=A0A455ZEV4_9FLAO|nr:GNAT family N-acetyltransferase [Elizabethkingia anophelis]AKH95211.1 hypothetical protein M876_11600 [Elizabethkingia anophelis FMS-007]DAC75296.1 TPA_exp: hypothetical protein [Elizabethkingia anophelis]